MSIGPSLSGFMPAAKSAMSSVAGILDNKAGTSLSGNILKTGLLALGAGVLAWGASKLMGSDNSVGWGLGATLAVGAASFLTGGFKSNPLATPALGAGVKP